MESLVDSILIFGRSSLGASVGLAIGWPTQRDRHSRYVAGWVLVGYVAGMIAMWPEWEYFLGALVLLPLSTALGLFVGWYIGVWTLGSREDWYLRAWGFAGCVAVYHLLAFGFAAIINMRDS